MFHTFVLVEDAMHNGLSRSSQSDIQRYLDRAEVLSSTRDQLIKDLALDPAYFPLPPVGDGAFEVLRATVLPVLEALFARGVHDLQVAIYRVDIPEGHLKRTMEIGGLDELAGEVVLRALQKVLTRLRYAGKF